ncbi:MCE family protein [Mycolicibacterium stellerae]|uniref:MCE family protein n=1 Tax=Mycolicibacterium stellerae TaxID=2358193 RepID=UPI000F0B21A9|nr:MlaD family protein [Mycolicibacterium stellerae]
MLTRLVRIQLTVFTIAAVAGIGVMLFSYMQLPTLLGIGRITVTLELPAAGGLYRFANVTYRGLQIGKVTEIRLVAGGARATLMLNTYPRVPADLTAEVRSVSAVGEQYVDLRPRSNSAPYLADGSVITLADSKIPQQVGPMLDQVSALIGSIPRDEVRGLLDESFDAFNGAGYDLGSLIDSSSSLADDVNGVADQTANLITNTPPLLDSQAQTSAEIRAWAHGGAGVSDQVVQNDPEIRTVLQKAPGAAEEASRLLEQLKPTLPVLLANLTTIGQIGVTYHASLQQILVLLPPFVAAIQTVGLPTNNPTGIPQGDFSLTVNDPPACTVGFLPPSSWRSPADTTDIDTPDGLYCKLPQDSPISVRGARNYPCMAVPGKRAPTVQQCDSDLPYEPLAMRQHVLGPNPFDPNLVSQGVPPDGRITDPNAGIYGPVEGTAPPPPVASDGAAAPPVTPSAFHGGASGTGPLVAYAQYDPRTGSYIASDGKRYTQSNLAGPLPTSWTDLLPR